MRSRGVVGLLVAAVVAAGGVVMPSASSGAQAAPLDTAVTSTGAVVAPPTDRLGGRDRYAVSVTISRHRYADPATAQTVYLTRGDTFADALTAGTIEDGPVLLIRPGCAAVPPVILEEIERIDPERVVALGGTTSVCDDQLQEAAAGRASGRLDGDDRFEAAASIAGHAFPNGAGTVYLTKGEVTPDAVVGGSLKGGPILLTSLDGKQLPDATADAIAALNPTRVVALGGTASVSQAVLDTAAAGRVQERIGGDNRYEVARKIADRAYPGRTSRAYIARGDGNNFVDAVASGMLADGPVLLTPGTCARVAAPTRAELAQRTPDVLVALGGPATLCDSTLTGAAMAARGTIDCGVRACVALTYDDGPGEPTPALLDAFAAAGIPGTFFALGRNVAASPEVTHRTLIEGHEIGNHTYDHPRLPDLTRSQQQDQMDRNDVLLRSLGVPTTRLMRPPYLASNADTRLLGKAVIMTDVNPKDWTGASTEAIRTYVRDNVRSGSIVIQHDTMPNTVAAVPGIIADLQARGYTFVTVSELVPGLAPGDLVYNRDTVRPLGTAVSMTDVVELDDGRRIGPLFDETGVPGVAPQLTREEILGIED